MEVKINSYNDMMKSVIKWNKIGYGDIERTEDRIALQRDITLSEVEETIQAIRDRDIIETLDGVADVFVTGSFMAYLSTGYDMADLVTFDGNMLAEADGMTLINMIKTQTATDYPNHYSIQYLIGWACAKYGGAPVMDYMNAVLASNMSKFVPSAKWGRHDIDVVYMKYSDMFTDIVSVEMTGDDGQVYHVVRADNGAGKILKPPQYKDPIFFLDSKTKDMLGITIQQMSDASLYC